jgi:tyrosyl-tRNA synthetase
MFRPVDEQLAILLRGAAQVETEKELRAKLERSLKTNTPLRVKIGIDPTGYDVHLGHTVPLRKLRQFQELGHTPVLLIGIATAMVGDPSGRDSSRAGLTREQIEKNAETYLAQIGKVLDISQVEIVRNSDWFGRWGFADMLRLLGRSTVQQILVREDFGNRVKAGTPIYLHECLYPLLQGWDSVEIKADVELGGTEQLINLTVGRDLQRAEGQEPQVCFTLPILRGLDGEKKMGKSLGNFIGVTEPQGEQFGKTMSIPDPLMREWFTLLTDFPAAKIDEILAGHPNAAKRQLAMEVVRTFYGPEAAERAHTNFDEQFKRKGDPDDMPEVSIPAGEMNVLDLIVAAKLTDSKGQARKKVEEGAFNYGPDKTKPADWKATVAVTAGLVLRLGRKIVRVKAS